MSRTPHEQGGLPPGEPGLPAPWSCTRAGSESVPPTGQHRQRVGPSPELAIRLQGDTVPPVATPVLSAPRTPTPRLLPPEHAYDYEFWTRRLVDSELLEHAVAVALFRAPLLAVPMGGTRRGGQLHMVEEVFARQTVAALSGLPGFVQLSHKGPVVEWGDERPSFCGTSERLQFYGLHDPVGELDGPTKPSAGDRLHGPRSGLWPPASPQPFDQRPPSRGSGAAVAAALS
ncbi:DUF6302 family protein [Streptomyces krungchingensis]|uniref:DUF6302 family protein n=1 Tax=Streptomyces krungchingensis TaxID=1565034 RepID=UPI003CF6745F